MSYFNEDQRDYMRYLDTLPPEKKCACGWYAKDDVSHKCQKAAFDPRPGPEPR